MLLRCCYVVSFLWICCCVVAVVLWCCCCVAVVVAVLNRFESPFANPFAAPFFSTHSPPPTSSSPFGRPIGTCVRACGSDGPGGDSSVPWGASSGRGGGSAVGGGSCRVWDREVGAPSQELLLKDRLMQLMLRALPKICLERSS